MNIDIGTDKDTDENRGKDDIKKEKKHYNVFDPDDDFNSDNIENERVAVILEMVYL